MKKLKLNNKGFSAIEGLLIAVVVILVAGIGYYVYQSGKETKNNASQQQTEQQPTEEAATEEAEAGNWRVIASGGGFYTYMCRSNVSSPGRVRYFVKRVHSSYKLLGSQVTVLSRSNYQPRGPVANVIGRPYSLTFSLNPNSNPRIKAEQRVRLSGSTVRMYTGYVNYRSLPRC